jgi:hypothetical protein
MFTPLRWYPNGLGDGGIELGSVDDPERELWTMHWILVKTGDDLGRFKEWDREPTVVVICVEAVQERPSLLGWHGVAEQVFFVTRDQVTDIPSGPVLNHDRYRLRDLAAERP